MLAFLSRSVRVSARLAGQSDFGVTRPLTGPTVLATVALLVVGLPMVAAGGESGDRPNIVFILADDMGYGDLGCYGHPVAKTPRIDSLARQGARFTQAYSNGPECSPTRTAFLTGRYQQRVGGLECAIGTGNVGRYDDAIRLADARDLGLPAGQTVIPAKLNEVGYRCGVFGKWHLGYEPKFNPMEHGWASFSGYLGGNVHYFNHRETSDLHVLYRGRLPVHRQGYMTTLITDDAIDFIRDQEGPFFLYVSHECPHFPFQGPEDAAKRVTEENWMDLDQEAYVAMLENLDGEVGRILDTLEEMSLAEKTLVVFASDNGGFAGAADMGSLRGAKGTTLEGGIRVPMVMRWPGKIDPQTVCDIPCLTFDLTCSFLQAAGADIGTVSGAGRSALDGIDIVGQLTGGGEESDRTLFWRGRRGDRTWAAARHGDWKWVRKTEGSTQQEWLYHLGDDVGETTDLTERQPAVADRLRGELRRWQEEVRPRR